MAGKSRADLRASIFSSKNSTPKSLEVEFFGEPIEIRQPSVDSILNLKQAVEQDAGDAAQVNRTAQMVNMIILYSYVPGTDEHVFEDGDLDQMRSMPFGEDFMRVQQAISKLTNVDLNVRSAEKN